MPGKKEELLHYIHDHEPALQAEWEEINKQESPSNPQNFYYYAMKSTLALKLEDHLSRNNFNLKTGDQPYSKQHFDVEANIIELDKLDPCTIDDRLIPTQCDSHLDFLKKSDAVILNIDYPLGYAAYNLLSKAAESVSEILGIYIMGKAASLNGVRGDVIIPEVVYDEHS